MSERESKRDKRRKRGRETEKDGAFLCVSDLLHASLQLVVRHGGVQVVVVFVQRHVAAGLVQHEEQRAHAEQLR